MSKLIDSAKEIVSNLNYHRLAENGFPKDFSRYCFTATYPPLKAMAPVTPKQIFKHTSPSSGSYDLYLHYPFCSGKCTFCHFPTYSYNPKFSESYISALIKEISLVSLSLNHPKISTIYFGGGSPSLITLENLSKIITEVKKEFNLQDLKQFTLEIHPELFNTKDSEQFFRNIKKLGINRVSIGIQDFNLKVLEAVNRRHDTKEAVEIIKLASKYFTVNIDLLCPLPHQTLSTWEQTIKKAFALKPDSITLYTTAIREHMAIYRDYSSNKTLPSLDDYFTMYSMTQLLAADLSYTENPAGCSV